jgi:hypothetical protein
MEMPMFTPYSAPSPALICRLFTLVMAAFVVLMTTACPLDDIFEEPQILSMTVTPDTIPRSDVGMTDEYFTVTLRLLNFTEEITDVVVFIQEPYLEAVPQEEVFVSEQGDEIELRGIAKTWFSGYTPGVYNIGALVRTATISVRENNLATVTVTD